MVENAHDPDADQARVIDDALALLAPYGSILLAVSGGPDSVALMLACAHWPLRTCRKIVVATVDHGLRADSRAEAETVARWAQTLGFPHHILSWADEKPTTRLQERARQARYALLADCAKRIGAGAVVTAHHADDQAETILFRLTRGSGVAGLAGMAPVSGCDGVALLRPLLGIGKQELIDLCLCENHPFVTDPSNASERFARTKLRTLAPALAAQGLDRDALLRLGARAAQADVALARYASETYERALRNDAPQLSLDAQILHSAPREVLQRTLALAIKHVAPQAALRLERLERATARVAHSLETGLPLRLTLADVMIETHPQEVKLCIAPPRKTRR